MISATLKRPLRKKIFSGSGGIRSWNLELEPVRIGIRPTAVPICGLVAQMVEQWTSYPKVVGSSPT